MNEPFKKNLYFCSDLNIRVRTRVILLIWLLFLQNLQQIVGTRIGFRIYPIIVWLSGHQILLITLDLRTEVYYRECNYTFNHFGYCGLSFIKSKGR